MTRASRLWGSKAPKSTARTFSGCHAAPDTLKAWEALTARIDACRDPQLRIELVKRRARLLKPK